MGPFLVDPFTRGRDQPHVHPFRYGWANALDEREAKVDTKNPDRGPLLIVEGETDHTVPRAIANAASRRQRRNPAVTETVTIPNRGHSLTIDPGRREVARTALDFVKRFA